MPAFALISGYFSNAAPPTTPHWTLWFLLALGVFRLVLPYLVLLRWPLVWSVLLKPRWLFIELDTGTQRKPAGPSRKGPTGSTRDR